MGHGLETFILFFGLPAIVFGFILTNKYLKNKKLEMEKKIQENKMKLLEEENKKLDKILKINEEDTKIEI
jgi:cell shape-determining protein MreC